MQFVCSDVRVDNLLWPRIAREESPEEGLSALTLPVATSVGVILTKFIDVGRSSPLRVEPFPKQDVLSSMRGEMDWAQASKEVIGFPVSDCGYAALTSSYGGLLPRIMSWDEPLFSTKLFLSGCFIKATEMKLEQVPIGAII